MQITTQGPFKEDDVLARFADTHVWLSVIEETYLPILTHDPLYPGLEMLALFLESDGAEIVRQHLRAARPDIGKDLVVKTAKLHATVRHFVKHSQAPTKLRFMIHSITPEEP